MANSNALALLPVLLCAQLATAAPRRDLVTRIPGFAPAPFKVYSGLLTVPGPLNGYDSLSIHYQLHTSQRDPSHDPLLVWHQGGPGGSAITGLYMEMGYFQVDENGPRVNPHAWNQVANMLYLESPAGAGFESGYSACIKRGEPVPCFWDDVTQSEAYAHTLAAFMKAFPEFATRDLYLSGESYFGASGPNIVAWILRSEEFKERFNLKGIAVGNGCWGVECCGPNFERNDMEFYAGKGLISVALRDEIREECAFPDVSSARCKRALGEMDAQIGPHDPENVYNNCPLTEDFLTRHGKSQRWLRRTLRQGKSDPTGTHRRLVQMNGGYEWACGGFDATRRWLVREDIKKALHLSGIQPGRSNFTYNISGPYSYTLYPELARKIRILVYNGDSDPSVPFAGDEEWIGSLVKRRVLEVTSSWAPWRATKGGAVSGSITKMTAPRSGKDFNFITVRLAGHTVPTFQPQAALAMISRFLNNSL